MIAPPDTRHTVYAQKMGKNKPSKIKIKEGERAISTDKICDSAEFWSRILKI